ncbi:copper resistance protein [Meristemomyces frigidus]|nr:copper resistance protein [Meristemomyces frigidus]
MRFSRSTATAAIAASLPLALAQTSTDCDPTKKSCPADTGLNAATYSADFTTGSSANASWSGAAYTVINYGSDGAEFSISKAGEAPTIQTDFYIFFGRIEVKMKAATGTGIVSSIVLESDDLDEIDWEFLGGDTTEVETNFFGKGNTTAYDRAIYYPVSTPQASFHTYTIDWTSERIEFIIDGTTVRTLAYTDPLTVGGTNYPQTPMRLKLGNWCGGCPGIAAGTIEWAGGNTTFDNAPYTMVVESVNIQNNNPADSYEWGDETGSWESINVVQGNSSSSASSSAGSASASTSTVSAKGSATASSVASSATAAPTSSVSVAGVQHQTVAAVSSTVTGSSYSVNTASASAQNADTTTAVGATTQVPGSPTGSSSASTSSGVAQSGTSDASANSIMAAGSLLSVALGFLML